MACTLSGALVWVSDPQDGCTHDAQALRRSGLLDVPATDLPNGTPPPKHIGDKGYTSIFHRLVEWGWVASLPVSWG